MSDNLTSCVITKLIEQRWVLLCVGVVLAAGGALVGQHVQLDRSIEHMFAADDPILGAYEKLQQTFGRRDIVLVVYPDPEMTTAAGKQRIDTLAQQVREVPGVAAVVSLLDPPAAADFDDDQRGARFREVFVGYTHNEALDAAGVVCLLERTKEGAPHRETLDLLRATVKKVPGGTLVGEPVLVEEAFDLLDVDGKRLNTWCTLLLMATIFVCFRSLRWLLLPLVVVQMTLALTRGVLAVFNLQLSMVSSMLAAIVTVVGVATVVHVIVRHRDALAQGLTPTDALLKASQILAVPILFACLTDAAGFASLMTSRVEPVYDFGLMMTIGCVMVLVSVLLVVPGIVLWGHGPAVEAENQGERKLRKALDQLLSWSSQHRQLLYGAGVVMTAVALFGCLRLERETDFTRNIRSDSSLVQGYQFVEEQFGGAGVWDILLPAPARLDKPYLLRVLDLEKTLHEEVPQLTSAISIADALNAGSGGLRQLALGAPLAIRGGLSLMRLRMPEFIDAIYHVGNSTGENVLRVMLRSPERLAAAEKTKAIEQVSRLAKEAFPTAEVTGSYVLLAQLIESLLRDQWTTFAVAAVAIFAMMAVAFRSLGLALATLVPNALPVVWLFGAMGLIGIRVNMGAAMIAAVSLGLSVDGSIHYVMSYQRERRCGASVIPALQAVHATVGRAAVFATLALVIGFATLCYSEFVPTIYFGALVSLSMICGLVGNLLVLPLLIQLVDRAEKTAPDDARDETIGPPRPHIADVDHAHMVEDRVHP